jgi:voltage-gated sodium channel
VSPEASTKPRTHGSGPIASTCARIADSGRFQGFIFAVIAANAVVLGLETYPSIEADAGDLLDTLDSVFLGVFVIELAIRIAAYGRRPQDFFREG